MRTLVGLTVVGCLLAAGAALLKRAAGVTTNDARAHPQALLDIARKDFGAVAQGEVLIAEFPIRNAGDRRLIVSASAACCGAATDEALIVQPGQVETLRIEVDSARWSGQLSRTDWFTTNDPELPRFSVTVTADVR